MPRSTPTRPFNDSYLMEYSAEHVAYEFDMFLWSARLGTSRTPLNAPTNDDVKNLNNALIEAFVVHLRNVIEFLYPPKPPKEPRPTDIVATDFYKLGKWQEDISYPLSQFHHRPFPCLPLSYQRATPRLYQCYTLISKRDSYLFPARAVYLPACIIHFSPSAPFVFFGGFHPLPFSAHHSHINARRRLFLDNDLDDGYDEGRRRTENMYEACSECRRTANEENGRAAGTKRGRFLKKGGSGKLQPGPPQWKNSA
jgi:hypothetical protein